MPEYTFSCKACGNTENRDLPMKEVLSPQLCDCGSNKLMIRKYYPPQINSGFKEWFDIGDNRWITSSHQQNEIMKREGKYMASHSELSQEARKNRINNQIDREEKSAKELKEKIGRVLSK